MFKTVLFILAALQLGILYTAFTSLGGLLLSYGIVSFLGWPWQSDGALFVKACILSVYLPGLWKMQKNIKTWPLSWRRVFFLGIPTGILFGIAPYFPGLSAAGCVLIASFPCYQWMAVSSSRFARVLRK